MRDQQSATVHLRHLLPLVAAAGLLLPGAAVAAGPAPDSAPARTGLAPDPAPAKPSVRIPLAVSPLTNVTPTPPANRSTRAVVTRTPTPASKPHHRVVPVRRPTNHAVPIVDVVPSSIDLHPELGALPTLPRDESKLVLAAAALLAAAAAAGTGTMLALTARVRR